MRVVVERAEKRGEGNHELCGSERRSSLTAIESILLHLNKGAHEPHPHLHPVRDALVLCVLRRQIALCRDAVRVPKPGQNAKFVQKHTRSPSLEALPIGR